MPSTDHIPALTEVDLGLGAVAESDRSLWSGVYQYLFVDQMPGGILHKGLRDAPPLGQLDCVDRVDEFDATPGQIAKTGMLQSHVDHCHQKLP